MRPPSPPCLALAAAVGCGPASSEVDVEAPVEGTCANVARADPFVDCVESFEPRDGVAFGHDRMPQVVLGAPEGGGEAEGSTDVVSLGCGGQITLYFADPILVDAPGPDLIVFENAFKAGDIMFVEPAQVLVSADGEVWEAFECDVDGSPATPPRGCAGATPVQATQQNGLGVDPDAAGGDAFDLADVGLSEARYVRIVDVTEAYYGHRTWCEGDAGGFDLDAAAAVPRG